MAMRLLAVTLAGAYVGYLAAISVAVFQLRKLLPPSPPASPWWSVVLIALSLWALLTWTSYDMIFYVGLDNLNEELTWRAPTLIATSSLGIFGSYRIAASLSIRRQFYIALRSNLDE